MAMLSIPRTFPKVPITIGSLRLIFITQDDILGEGRPIYHIERKIEKSGASFNDGSHIIYVNGNCRYDQTALSRLMHDFFCTRSSDMHYQQLQERVKYLKETEEGVQTMCKIINDLSNAAFAQDEAKGEIRGEAKATLNIATMKPLFSRLILL